MVDLIFELAGQERATPRNAKELKLITNWGSNTTLEDKSEAEVSTNAIQFILEDADFITDYVAKGNIFEGIPYAIKLRNVQTQLTTQILDGYIDLAESAKFISCDEVESVIKKRKNLDWLTSQADSFSFAYLHSLGLIKNSDFIPVPYVLNQRPEGFALVMISMSIFMSTKELISAIKATVESITSFVNIIAVQTGVELGQIISAGLLVTANIVYTIALSYALVKMTEELIDQLFPPVRRYNGMRIKRLFEIGCSYLGLTFQSSIFDGDREKNLTFVPIRSEKGGLFGASNGLGFPNQQSAIYNFGDFLRTFKEFFNAKIKLVGNTLYFERADFWNKKAGWILPDVETDQDLRLSSYEYNTNEIASNLMISFQTDVQDENTLESFKGTNYQVITKPIATNNIDYVNIKGLSQVRLPFALATRKSDLTIVEEALKLLTVSVDKTVNALGSNSTLSKSITNRIGMMVQSADTTNSDKLLVLKGEQIPLTESNRLTAKYIWENYHLVNSFVEILDPKTNKLVHNQYKLYKGVTIPFCEDDWNTLLNNNKITTVDGKEGLIESIEWDVNNEIAKIDYRIKQLYTKNLNLAFNEGT